MVDIFRNKQYKDLNSKVDSGDVVLGLTMAGVITIMCGMVPTWIDDAHNKQEEREMYASDIERLDPLIDGGYQDLVSQKNETEETVKSISEACRTLINPFLPQGQLSGVDYSIAAQEVALEPNQPCGDSVVDIHITMSDIERYEVVSAEIERLGDYNNLVQQRADLGEEPQDDSLINGMLIGGVPGIIASYALLHNLMISPIRQSRRRERDQREYN